MRCQFTMPIPQIQMLYNCYAMFLIMYCNRCHKLETVNIFSILEESDHFFFLNFYHRSFAVFPKVKESTERLRSQSAARHKFYTSVLRILFSKG